MASWDTPTRAPPGGTTRPGTPRPPPRPRPRPGSTGRLSLGLHTEPRTQDRGPGADPTAAPGSLSMPPGMPAALITRPTAKRRDLARRALQPLKRTQHAEGAGPIRPHGFGGYQEWGRSGRTPPDPSLASGNSASSQTCAGPRAGRAAGTGCRPAPKCPRRRAGELAARAGPAGPA